MNRVALYSRVSTRDRGQDVENQLAQLRTFAAHQGWTIVHEYVDHESGKTSDRAQFQRLFADASQGRFDILLFWSLDRLTREGVFPTLQHLTRLTGYGIQWRSYTEQYLDSTGIFRDAVIGILATIARQERLRISERTKAGLERARRQGKTLGRPRVQLDVEHLRKLRSQGVTWDQIVAQTGIAKATAQRAVYCGPVLVS